MSPALRVEIADSQRIFHAGDTLRGVAHIEQQERSRCDTLRIALVRWCYGADERVETQEHVLTLRPGPLEVGSHSYPFEILLPGGPVTYHGALVNVEWGVRASADLPWADDPSDTQEITLLASDALSPPHPAEGALITQNTPQGGEIYPIIIGLFSIGAAVSLIIVSFPDAVLCTAICAAPFIIFGLYLILFTLNNRFAQLKVGPVTLSIEEHIVTAGDDLNFIIAFNPPTSGSLNLVKIELIGQEVFETGHGKKRRVSRVTTHHIIEEIAHQLPLSAGQPVELPVTLSIPEDAAPSLSAQSYSVQWDLRCRLDLPGSMDWSEERRVWVLPLGARKPAASPPTEAS